MFILHRYDHSLECTEATSNNGSIPN
uniref:Uncharacterized protein n=1 Tax=Arundo donax TaxID=35708 RepID=A0A0A8Y9H9_ARUDO